MGVGVDGVVDGGGGGGWRGVWIGAVVWMEEGVGVDGGVGGSCGWGVWMEGRMEGSGAGLGWSGKPKPNRTER